MKFIVSVVASLVSFNAWGESLTVKLYSGDAVSNVMYLHEDFALPSNGCVKTTKALGFTNVRAQVQDHHMIRFDIPGGKFATVANHPDGPATFNEVHSALIRNGTISRTFGLTLHCQYHFCVRDSTWYLPQEETRCNLTLDL